MGPFHRRFLRLLIHSRPLASRFPRRPSIMHAVFYEQRHSISGLDFLAQVAMFVIERESSSASDRSEYGSDTDQVQAPQAVALYDKMGFISQPYTYPSSAPLDSSPPPSPLVTDVSATPGLDTPSVRSISQPGKITTKKVKKAIGVKAQSAKPSGSTGKRRRTTFPVRKSSSVRAYIFHTVQC